MMRRVLSLIIVAVILCASLSGCHGSRGMAEFVIPEEFDTTKTYEISFWAKNDTNKAQTRVYEKAINEFQELYPNVKVNLKLYTDYGRIYNDVITNIQTNTTPNVCITYPDHIATYLTGTNTVVSLNELMDDERYGLGGSEIPFDGPTKEEIIPEFLNECIVNGEYHALPYMRSTEALYINKTYVEKLGYTVPDVVTWDYIWEVSEAATKKDADGNYIVNGQKVMIPFIYKSTDNMMIQMLRQKGAGYSTQEGEVLLFNETTEEILNDVADAARAGSFSTFKISSYPANFLNAGQCIFAIDSTAGATWMGTDAPLSDISEDQLVRFETVVRTIPQYDVENPVMISQGPSVCIFNKEDKQEVLASWLFMQYLLTDGIQIGYAKTEGYVPVTSKAQENPEYLDYLSREGQDNNTYYDIKLKATKLLIENTENTFVTPVFNGSASVRDAAGQLIENTVKSINRKETVDDKYFDNLYDNITSLYRLGQINLRGNVQMDKEDMGELPKEAKMLIYGLVSVWVILGVYVAVDVLKNKKTEK